MSETSNYRRLGRNGSTLFQRARSVSTFVLLVVVVVCVFFAYQYISNSTELSTFRAEFEQSNALNARLKNELLELNVKLEKERLAEQQCRERREETNKRLEACKVQNEIDQKLSASHLDANKILCERNVSELNEQMDSAKSQMLEQKRKFAGQVANLTQTVERLRTELALLRHLNTGINDIGTATLTNNTNAQRLEEQTKSGGNNGNGTKSGNDEILSQPKWLHQSVLNDAHEHLDESEMRQQKKHQHKEFDNNDENEQPQRHLMGAGGRMRFEEMAEKAAKGANGRGELLQAAAAAQQKGQEDKAQDSIEQEGEDEEKALPYKADGEAEKEGH
ncbi:hypothetical protein niasHT_026176 [Heterodera trifolii]|uniref:Uncharacterized protein n=1 Tax=Heterodera trifolii TaxID=157864 RepID=A0ABD2K1N1_9BILA